MEKLILVDNSEIMLVSGSTIVRAFVELETFEELENLANKLISPNNIQTLKIQYENSDFTYEGMTCDSTFKSVVITPSKITVELSFRKMTEMEMQEVAVQEAFSYLSDEQALSVKTIAPNWDDNVIGYEYKMDNPFDARRQYNDRLWKLNKPHKKQLDWYPGADPTLWTEIIVGHEGTIEDPIPVPDSVTTSGFEYEYGKYYSENDVIYLCQREGEEPGGKITLYYAPSNLINHYFVVAESTEESSDIETSVDDTEETTDSDETETITQE